MSSAAPKPSPPPVGGGWCSFSLEKSVSSRPKPPSSVVRIGEKGEIGVAVARKLRRRAMFIGRPAPHESLPSSVAACERVVLGGIACGSMPLLVKFMPLQRSLGDLVHDPGYKHGAPDGAFPNGSWSRGFLCLEYPGLELHCHGNLPVSLTNLSARAITCPSACTQRPAPRPYRLPSASQKIVSVRP